MQDRKMLDQMTAVEKAGPENVVKIGCFPTQALAFSPVSIQKQRAQRNQLRLDGNRA